MDFDYNGYGLFESLASDQQEERRAQRKALVTAQARVESNLGRFFAASRTGEEFDERYSLVQQEFVGTVREAAEEFGVQHDNIANTILAHYRKRAWDQGDREAVEDGERDADEASEWYRKKEKDDDSDDSEDDKERESRFLGLTADGGSTEDDDDDAHYRRAAPNRSECACGAPFTDEHIRSVKYEGEEDDHNSSVRSSVEHTADGGEKGECSECGKEGFLKGGVCGPCRGKKLDSDYEQNRSDNPDLADAEDYSFGEKESHLRWAALPYPGQQGNSAEELEYLDREHPINYDDGSLEGDHLHGRHYDHPHPQCPWCQDAGGGSESWVHDPENGESYHPAYGRVAAKGADDEDSSTQETVDLPSSKQDNDTGLGGPSPKIDKGQAGNQADIEVPSKRHPTERVDVTEALPRTNESELKGIGEQTTERQDLPTADGFDGSGFAKNNQEQAPHTDTWGDKGQVEPVTNQALSNMRWAANMTPWLDEEPFGEHSDLEAPQQPTAQICPACERGDIVGGVCNHCHTPYQPAQRSDWAPEQIKPYARSH